MHEIVTLQFGPRANYTGTHFWNIQESYFTYNPADSPSIVDHDISFRPGKGADGADTYTPRALVYDFKAGFGSLRKINALYEVENNQPSENTIWHGGQKIHTAPPVEPSTYQVALESGLPTSQMKSKDVRYWSDYNRVYYHPRSLVQLSNQSLTSQICATESFAAGMDLFRDLDQEIGGLLDRDVRFFAEECDELQGFQVLGTSDDAWGGFMARYIEALEDDYGKKSVWVWSLEDSQRESRTQQLNRITNSAHSLVNMLDHVSANIRVASIPTKLPSYINLDTSSLWSTSALSAAAIETVTLPLRLRQGASRNARMAFMADLLENRNNRKLWDVGALFQPSTDGLPNGHGHLGSQQSNGGASHDARLRSADHDTDEVTNFDIDFTPKLPRPQTVFPSLQANTLRVSSHSHTFGQIESHRDARLQNHSNMRTGPGRGAVYQTQDEDTLLDMYETSLAFPLLDAFPADTFRFPAAQPHNAAEASTTVVDKSRGHIGNLAMSAALSTRSSTKIEMLKMRDLVVGRSGRAMNLVDSDTRETLYDELTKVAEAYTYGYEDDFSEADELDD